MLNRGREAPKIPDHEVIRQIGRGAFGEVWLARAVTGVYRAAKVIWREDFELERDFEREFEAIKRYEPISRQHPGLVQVLQVGRDDAAGFYYYIMEVSDDAEGGEGIDPDSYVPHTFRTEIQRRDRIALEVCAEQGALIADALYFLHKKDLIHRDVKLSNVIFVEGQAKLADIGLVAALGDRSFVGTEGYVPPEGAGTPAADIFSLGMVIYELATGKDRLDFPDVPSSFREMSDPSVWQRINKVVCRACARRSESRYANALDMALELRGEEVPSARPGWPLILGGVASLALVAILFVVLFARPVSDTFEIISEPPGAKVWAGEELLGETPLSLPVRPEEGITFEIIKAGFRHERIEYAGASDTRAAISVTLEDSKFPQPGAYWTNSLGLEFKPTQSGHRLARPVGADLFLRFCREEGRIFEGEVAMEEVGGEPYPMAVVSSREGRALAEWMQRLDVSSGYIGSDYAYRSAPVEDPSITWPNRRITFGRTTVAISPVEILVEKRQYGSLAVNSWPEGASVIDPNGEEIGKTPLQLSRIRTGSLSYELRLEGYKSAYIDGIVEANGLLELESVLEQGEAVEMGKRWVNSLGVILAPVSGVLVATTETRVQDFRLFCERAGLETPRHLSASQGVYPVDQVSREDAEAFCAWLTQKERDEGSLSERHEYRLPTDEEWSRAAGLPPERGTTPSMRNGHMEGIFPWGYEWPPPDGAGNFADESYRSYLELTGELRSKDFARPAFIAGYDDSFPKLAWVNELVPNQFGLYHISGNVWEWVSDDYFGGGGGTESMGTIRGGSWQTAEREELLSSYRRSLSVPRREEGVGFRYVLARSEFRS